MTKTEEICIKWLNKNFNYMEPFIAKGYDGYVFHMKNGKCILQYNKINGYLHISYGEIWSFLESMFGMSFKEIRELTKIWAEQYYVAKVNPITPCIPHVKDDVEEQYKMRVMTTHIDFTNKNTIVEQQYKMKVNTICCNPIINNNKVEEQYKMKVNTILEDMLTISSNVEELYKMREVTTKPNHFIDLPVVEEQYKMREVTTIRYLLPETILVEEQYKMREVTTGMAAAELSKVEEQYKMNVKEVTINMDSVTTKVEGQYTELMNECIDNIK